jgi:secondary thiamine-phosphate synthase enzyme
VVFQETLTVKTRGRGFYEVTATVGRVVAVAGVHTGLCNVFIRHTSASLVLSENADPGVCGDLERFMARLVPDGDPLFEHVSEGADDMPAHIRSVLTQASVMLPIGGGRCLFGTWQGLYVWEHRRAPHTRELLVTIYGD